MKVALLFNQRPADLAVGPDDAFEEYDSLETVEYIADALRLLNIQVQPVLADRDLPSRLDDVQFDFALNIAEGPLDLTGSGRRCREAIPAAVCEMLGLPYTGSDPLTLAATLDKAIARRIVSPEVPVARAVLIEDAADAEHPCESDLSKLAYPAVVKPNDEGSSKGIRNDCLVADVTEAVERIRELQRVYECPVLVEEFLSGAEVTVGVAGNGKNTRILGLMEIGTALGSGRFLYSLEAKRDWRRQVSYHVPPRLDAGTINQLSASALAAYRLLGCRDIARMDFRLDVAGEPRFIECNPLPGLNPETGDIVLLSRSTLPYERLVQGILLDAAQRTGVRLHEGADSSHAASSRR